MPSAPSPATRVRPSWARPPGDALHLVREAPTPPADPRRVARARLQDAVTLSTE